MANIRGKKQIRKQSAGAKNARGKTSALHHLRRKVSEFVENVTRDNSKNPPHRHVAHKTVTTAPAERKVRIPIPPYSRKLIVKSVRTRTKKKAARHLRVPHKRFKTLQKHEANPIIEPNGGNFLEMKATFIWRRWPRTGACIFFTAQSGAMTFDPGLRGERRRRTISERLKDFVFEHRTKGESPLKTIPKISYLSGGGTAGGSEDPRLTMIDEDGRIYLTYTAFDGWGSVRIALSSISKDDFVNQRWRWSPPLFLSPFGEVHKNWVLFPEKINGKYAIIHSISPKILIEYVSDLSEFEDDGKIIKSHYNRFSKTGGWTAGCAVPGRRRSAPTSAGFSSTTLWIPATRANTNWVHDSRRGRPGKSAIPFACAGFGAGRMVRKHRLEIGRNLFLRSSG